MQQAARPRIFYGWRIVVAAASMQFLQTALVQYSFGVYVAVLRDAFGWSKTALAAAASLQQVEGALLGPAQGWIIDRFGPRGMIRVGVVLSSVGLMLLSTIDTLLGFYGAYLLIALGVTLSGFFPMSIAIINWFEKKRARALSILHLGLGVGGIVVPVVAWSLQSFGWRPTAFVSGLIILAAGLPLSGVVRRRPEDHGEVVDGGRGDLPEAQASGLALSQERDFSTRQALATRAFWLISIGHGLALCTVTAINAHAIVHMKEGLGYTLSQGASVMSLLITFYIGGVALGWWVGDRYEKRLIATGCMLFHMSALLLLAFATSAAMLIAFAIVQGIGWGCRGPFMSAMRADYFGRRAIGKIVGISAIVTVIGNASGPIIAGLFADAFGDYRVGFTVIALLAGVGSVCFLFAKPPPLPRAARGQGGESEMGSMCRSSGAN